MNWFALVVVVLVLGGVGCLFWKLHGGQDAPVSCIGCGKCIATGNASLSRRENVEKGRKTLDKINKKDIIIAVKQLKAKMKPVL